MDLLISVVPGPASIKDFIRGCYKVINEIYTRFHKIKDNDLFRKHIEEKLKELEEIIKYLETIELVEFPQVCAEYLQKFNESLRKCWGKCEELHNKGVLKKFIDVKAHKSELQYMEEHLKEANTHLQLTLSMIQVQQNKEGFAQMNVNLKEGNSQVMGAVIHPELGVYHGESADCQPPSAISMLNLSEDREHKLMIIKWYDSDNLMAKILRYEVRYDEGIIPGKPKDLSIIGSDTKFTMKLGHPKVVEKRSYIVQVRAVSMDGPGPWSEPSTIHFLCDQPSKPKIPDIKVFSPTQVAVEIQLPRKNEMNGSEVHSCAIEYMSEKKPVWERRIYNLEHKFVEKVAKTIESLEPNTRYKFRIVMINEIGESQPSNVCKVLTNQLIPGIPQGLRLSSKRTDKMIKIRWEPPLENPHIVQCYHAQIRRVKSRSDSWTTIPIPKDAINKLSAKATNLKTDTKYLFRVQAVNDRGESVGFTNSVEGETRVGKAARIAASTAAFFGGTIGGPLVGAAAGGVAAASGDDKSKSASVAAGIGGGVGGAILGTIGAPLMGGAVAAATYSLLKDGLTDSYSPQTSDDEETKE